MNLEKYTTKSGKTQLFYKTNYIGTFPYDEAKESLEILETEDPRQTAGERAIKSPQVAFKDMKLWLM